MNQKAKEKLSESITLMLEEVDNVDLSSKEREELLKDLVVLMDEDLKFVKEEDWTKVELAKVKAGDRIDLKKTAGTVVDFVTEHAYSFGTLAVTLFIAGAALDADTTGKMIATTVLRVLPKPKI